MSNTNHSNRGHALLSASGSSRWLNCTPSARLEARQSTSSSSIYADEGTLAHELADIELRFLVGQMDNLTYRMEIKKKKKEIVEFYDKNTSLGGDLEDMQFYVGIFVDMTYEKYKHILVDTPSAEIMLEQRLDYSDIVKGGYGTGDVCIGADNVLHVDDLKYGKGVQVDATENSQLMLYGFGALKEFNLMYDIKEIKLTIIQPRLEHYSSWTISKEELLKWGEEHVRPIASLAYRGEGEKKAGKWCKFCKVSALCKTNSDYNLSLAQHEFADPDLLSLEDLSKIMDQLPALEDWAKSVKSFLLKKANEGEKIPGYKLVNGRSNRTFVNEDKIVKTLLDEGYKKEQFLNSKLGGITQIEKLVGKKNIYDLIGDCIHKPQGKPTLAPESDPRPGIGAGGVEQALLDFQDED